MAQAQLLADSTAGGASGGDTIIANGPTPKPTLWHSIPTFLSQYQVYALSPRAINRWTKLGSYWR